MAPADPALEPYFALAEELDIPVGIHLSLAPPGTPYDCCPKFRVALGNPLLLEEVLIKHPRLRLYIMHGGHPWTEEMIGLMYIYPQVYADVSAINHPDKQPRAEFHEYLARMFKAGFGKRLMYGSDFGLVFQETIESIESAPFLTEEQKRDILYNNAARFLGLQTSAAE
jgi:predicted TIM-barrel fold metal-dependent hydrolase